MIGPSLPSHLVAEARSSPDTTQSDDEGDVPVMGPSSRELLCSSHDALNGRRFSSRREGIITNDDYDDDDCIGPQLPGSNKELEELSYYERRHNFEQEQASKDAKGKRDEWMLSLPENTHYGFGAKTFSKRGIAKVSDDWLETPEDKRRKEERGEVATPSVKPKSAQDLAQEEIVRQMNAVRGESLIVQHSKKAGGTAAGSVVSGPGGRKEWDRETEMKVVGLKDLSAAELKEHAAGLGTRFGHGTEKKYL
ncbi:unnamed protein product, partial [Mesorhabditis spiculigera]